MPVRYGYWVKDIFTHKLGNSLVTFQPIWPDIVADDGPHGADHHPRGDPRDVPRHPVGIFSAISQYSIFDYLFTSVSFLGFAMPTFWLALLLQILSSTST